MTTPYVKFSRGSVSAFNNLTEKNSDTLYFITDPDGSKSKLYLGDELISSEISNLADLEGLLIDNLADKDLLVYDAVSDKWVNSTALEAIGIYQGVNSENPGKAGLVPAAGVGQEDYFLAGDGTWKQVTSSTPVAATQVFEATPVGEESHIEALTRVVGETSLNIGDIGIVKVLIVDDKYEYTAYVYDGENWAAMDGNYSAENVYFKNDLTYTANIGVLSVPSSGSGTISAAGKNVKQVLDSILAKEENPTVTQPKVSITLNSSGAKEVGSTVTPSYSVSFSKGSYTYGPDTGIMATYKVTNSANSTEEKTTATGTFNAITVGDSTSYTVSVTAEYTEGAIPVTNLGNEVESLRIRAGSKSTTSSGKYTGYRNSFYGTFTEKAATLTSDDIRSLNATNKALSAGSEIALNITGGAGVMRIVFAYPATLPDLASVLDENDSKSNIVGAFSQLLGEINVEGANGYEAIPYKVWIQDLGSEYADNNVYTFKIDK